MFTSHPDGIIIEVWVVPGASRTEIAGTHDGALRLRVAAPPEDGKANKAAIKLLNSILNAPVELISGASSRRKRFLVRGAEAREVEKRLGESIDG